MSSPIKDRLNKFISTSSSPKRIEIALSLLEYYERRGKLTMKQIKMFTGFERDEKDKCKHTYVESLSPVKEWDDEKKRKYEIACVGAKYSGYHQRKLKHVLWDHKDSDKIDWTRTPIPSQKDYDGFMANKQTQNLIKAYGLEPRYKVGQVLALCVNMYGSGYIVNTGTYIITEVMMPRRTIGSGVPKPDYKLRSISLGSHPDKALYSENALTSAITSEWKKFLRSEKRRLNKTPG